MRTNIHCHAYAYGYCQLKNIPDGAGLSNIWLTQGRDISKQDLKAQISNILHNQSEKKWQADIQGCSKYTQYCLYKNELSFEDYLSKLPVNFQRAIAKFRVM